MISAVAPPVSRRTTSASSCSDSSEETRAASTEAMAAQGIHHTQQLSAKLDAVAARLDRAQRDAIGEMWASLGGRLDEQDLKLRPILAFGDDAYAMEECCAEIGAAFLCARLGIAHEPHPDHARYVHHWLKVLKHDARAIFAAAARAQEAVTYLDALQSPTAQQSAA